MNKDDYPKLTKETGWRKFSTDVTTVASVHGIENVLNPAYAPVPTDPDEVALFHLQKRFFYNVLRSNVETDVGKQIVSDHHDVLDGQQAWEALRIRYQDSHAAKLITHEKLLKIQQTNNYYTPLAWVLYCFVRCRCCVMSQKSRRTKAVQRWLLCTTAIQLEPSMRKHKTRAQGVVMYIAPSRVSTLFVACSL
jgi:hypothetical protein